LFATRSERAFHLVRRSWAALLYALFAAALVGWIAYEAATTRLITFSQGADYWEHSAALHALIASPFHPGNPHLVSDALSPRYHPIYVALALVARALDQDAVSAMGMAAVLNMTLLTGGVFWFFDSYFKDARAPLYAFFVLFTSWWQGWHFSNVYQLSILPSVAAYPSTSAIGLSFVGFALVTLIVRSGATSLRLVLLGSLAAMLLLVHPLTAVMGFTGMGLLALLEPGAPWRVRGWLVLALLGGALCAHFWPYYSAFEVISGGQGRVAGWVEKALASASSGVSGPEQPMFYKWRGLRDAMGLAAPGVLFALILLVWRKHLFVPLGLACMLAVFGLNMLVPLPLGHRFVLLAMVFLHLATVWGWLMLTPGYHDAWSFVRRPSVGVVASLLLFTVFGIGVWHNVELAENRVQQVSSRRLSPVLNYARQVGRKAGRGAVVLGTPRDSWPVPTFGPKIVALLHANPLVGDDVNRFADAMSFFSRSITNAQRDEILAKYGVTHVLAVGGGSKALRSYLKERATSQRLAAGYRLYTVKKR
jgi:hypothetical protein